MNKLTFIEWLSIYEFITKTEFSMLPEYKKENYKSEYKIYLNIKE